MARRLLRTGDSEFVTEGTMLAIPLAFPGQSSPPPADETAINCLALDPVGTVYCGTAGRRAHVLAAMLYGDSGAIFDLGLPDGATEVAALAVWDEWVYAVASGPGGCGLFRWPRVGRGFLIQEWTLRRPEAEKVCDLLPDGRIAHAVADAAEPALCGITDPGGQLVRINLDPPGVAVLADVDGDRRFSRRILLDGRGGLWGTRGRAMIYCWHPAVGGIEDVAPVPAAAGRAQHTQASAWALDEVTGAVYGGTAPDGFLFRIDPDGDTVAPLGKPARPDPINCLTVGHDGRVLGACGLAEDIGHVFRHDPADGSTRDLGVAVSVLTARQYGYHFRCMLTGPDGQVYLGQHERAAHLWVYYPPVPKRPPAGEAAG